MSREVGNVCVSKLAAGTSHIAKKQGLNLSHWHIGLRSFNRFSNLTPSTNSEDSTDRVTTTGSSLTALLRLSNGLFPLLLLLLLLQPAVGVS